MKKALKTNGNSWQLYLSKPIAKLMGISETEYTVLLTIENKTLNIKRINKDEKTKYENRLIKKLIKRSSGYGLNIPLPILELLEINPENDMLDINIEGDILIIKK